jgi:c-di-GMP-binding flagellar brake protein YcgR
MFVEESQLSGIQRRTAMRERIQLELQAFLSLKLCSVSKMRKAKQTLLMISERFMTAVLSGALTVLVGWSL